jgi:hypothetical protein
VAGSPQTKARMSSQMTSMRAGMTKYDRVVELESATLVKGTSGSS